MKFCSWIYILQDNECVVGFLQGNLAVFKGDHSKPWDEAHDLKNGKYILI